ncbi:MULTISPECIES: DUF7668 domain-containing protein [Enterobacteriaceae]|uniref:DUF7668 domain-containing protein n=1 Tax=Enterobacteriaceae TaxID=543 RepID=UPI0012501880|nr:MULTISPECIES: hypothetical protein [Enterobacteriaceae]EGR0592566.1 hypothetical protein [Vibrio cholerae]
MHHEIVSVIKRLVESLVANDIDGMVRQGENGRLSKEDIFNTLQDYPGEISLPPDEAYSNAVEYAIYDKKPEARKVEFDLWFDGYESDLTLSADVRKGDSGNFVISIDDIHVL